MSLEVGRVDLVTGLRQSLAEVLELCFPGSRIRIRFSYDTRATEHRMTWQPGLVDRSDEDLSSDGEAEILSAARKSEKAPEFAEVTVSVVFARTPDKGLAASWEPRSRWQALLFGRAPIAYEQLKYAFEAFLAWRTHRHTLPRSRPPSITRSASPIPNAKRPILIVAMYWLAAGGAESFALRCVARAKGLGFDVVVLCDYPSQNTADEAWAGFTSGHVRWVRSDLFGDEGFYRRLVLGLLDGGAVVAIHIHHSARMYALLPDLAARADRPLIVDTTHIVEHRDGGYVHLSGSLSRYIDHHHVISRSLRDYYRDHFGRTQEISLGYLLDLPAEAATIPRFSILESKKTVTVGFVGRLVHQKRPILFLEVARRLIRQSLPDVQFRFRVIGDGPQRAAARQVATVFGIGEAVEFLGHRMDVRDLMNDIDILLIPSGNEGLTLVAYEAFAAGTIVLSADVGAQGELIPPALLLDPSPFAFCSAATRTISRLATDGIFARQQVQAFVERHRQIETGPYASDVIDVLYNNARR